MKFVCIKNDVAHVSSIGHYFTPGKVYEAISIFEEYGNIYYRFINDKGITKDFSKWMLSTNRFRMVSLDEWRENRLEKLLSEPSCFQVAPMTFNPKKSIIERYGSKETIREIKIDKILK